MSNISSHYFWAGPLIYTFDVFFCSSWLENAQEFHLSIAIGLYLTRQLSWEHPFRRCCYITYSCTQCKRYRTCMLLNVAAQRVSIRNVCVKTWTSHNVQRHKTYSVTYTFCNAYVMCTLRFVTVYKMWRCTLGDVYVLELLHCVQLRYVTLRHVTFTLCCFTLCSNIPLRMLPDLMDVVAVGRTAHWRGGWPWPGGGRAGRRGCWRPRAVAAVGGRGCWRPRAVVAAVGGGGGGGGGRKGREEDGWGPVESNRTHPLPTVLIFHVQMPQEFRLFFLQICSKFSREFAKISAPSLHDTKIGNQCTCRIPNHELKIFWIVRSKVIKRYTMFHILLYHGSYFWKSKWSDSSFFCWPIQDIK